jgi:hypothetical protein
VARRVSMGTHRAIPSFWRLCSKCSTSTRHISLLYFVRYLAARVYQGMGQQMLPWEKARGFNMRPSLG